MPIKQTSATPEPQVVHDSEVGDAASLVTPVTSRNEEAVAAYARDLAFLEEEVEVMLHLPYDQGDSTRLVQVSIDNKPEFFIKGEWRKVKRKYVAQLAMARKESWNFAYKYTPDGRTAQTQHATQHLRYPFEMRDQNPNGAKWLQQLLANPV